MAVLVAVCDGFDGCLDESYGNKGLKSCRLTLKIY